MPTDAPLPYGRRTQTPPAVPELDILWITAGLSCDGDTVSMTAATQPALEDILLGAIPGLPRVRLHNPVLAYHNGEEFLAPFRRAAEGRLRPFLLVVEGSIPNEHNKAEGYWAALGTDPATGQPIPTCDWIDRLAPHAWAVMAAGTCAAYGGIHAMEGNPTGCMGLADYLGWDWKAKPSGIPIVNVPGCPVQPDNFMETLLYLLRQAADPRVPMIPLDDRLRPRWLFGDTVHEGCNRGGYYEQADFASDYGSPRCIVKLGCWGPVVQCNVGKRGWINGVGGCAGVGGICIGCTMPGFPDKFMPFMNMPPGALLSSTAIVLYGKAVRTLRRLTQELSLNQEPEWRRRGTADGGARPMTGAEEYDFRDRLSRIDGLAARLEAWPDPAARDLMRDLLRAVLDFHAAGLGRMLERMASDPEVGSGLAGRLARDGLVGSLLLLHGLHPEGVQRRMEQVLDRLRPRLHALGGDAELVEASAEEIRLRLRGDPSAGAELRLAVEEAVVAAAPDVDAVEIEEAWDRAAAGRISLPLLEASGKG